MNELTPTPTPVEHMPITLGVFLQMAGLARSGGEAKTLCQQAKIRVNGVRDTRRSHPLAYGDIVERVGQGSAQVVRPGDVSTLDRPVP